MPALLGGHVEALSSAYPSLSGAAGTNKITLIATNGAARSPLAPNVPAIAEIVPDLILRRSWASTHALAFPLPLSRRSRPRRTTS